MLKSVFSDLAIAPSDILVVVYGIPSLESMLPIIWAEKQRHPELRVKAVFLHEGTTAGFGHKHPLVHLAAELIDEIFFPFSAGWVHWKGSGDDHKLESLMRRSSKLSRLISMRLRESSLRKVETLLCLSSWEHLTMFDYDYLGDQFHQSYLMALCGENSLAVSHASTLRNLKRPPEFAAQRRDGSFFIDALAPLSSRRKILVHFDSMGEPLERGNLYITTPSVDRFDPHWLAFIQNVFREELKELRGCGPLGLLVSRPASSEPYLPDPDLRKRALTDIRSVFERLGLVPAVLLHPGERLKSRELKGWKVIKDVHYSVVFSTTEHIVTFGTQISEDSWRMGKKMIEYGPVRSVKVESEFHNLGKTHSVESKSELAELLTALDERHCP